MYAEVYVFLLSPFQLQITASIRERPLQATWRSTAAPTLSTVAVREPTQLVVTERGFSEKRKNRVNCSKAHDNFDRTGHIHN